MMIRKQLATVGTLLFLLSGGFTPAALATAEDVVFTQTTTSWVFAQEVLGARAPTSALGQMAPQTVTLEVMSGIVSEGGQARIEYRLTRGAQFASRNIVLGDLDFNDNSGSEPTVTVEFPEGGGGGRVGDSFVAFNVTVLDDPDATVMLETGHELVLTIPAIQNLEANLPEDVEVNVYITPLTTTSGGNFQTLSPLNNNDPDKTLVESENAVTLNALDAAAAATINVDMREQFVGTGVVSITPEAGGEQLQAIELGSFFVQLQLMNLLPGGTGTIEVLNSEGARFQLMAADRFRLAVSGNFHENALVFIDLIENKTVDDGETISLEEGLSFSVLNDRGMALMGPEFVKVYYATDGETDLTAGDYTVTLQLDYRSSSYLDEEPVLAGTEIGFNAIRQDGFAYAIPNCTQTDRARIRVTNEDESALNLFMEGTDQTGASLGFVEVDARLVRGGDSGQLQGRETLVLFSRHVEQLFGFNDGQYGKDTRCTAQETWSGRAQLEFLADGNITVTPLIRGTDGQLRDLGGFTGLVLGDDPDTDDEKEMDSITR